MDSVPPVEHFSLRWNNFQSTITSALAGLRDTQAFVDVTLWTDGRQIKAHRNVLSACSPVLLELLKDNPCAHPIIILRDVTHADLSAIVTYMYQGEVNVAPEALRTFLHTAQLLKVKGLADTGIQQEADACIYDSPVSAGSESPRPVSPPKRRRPAAADEPPPPELAPAPAPATATAPAPVAVNGHGPDGGGGGGKAVTPEPEPPETEGDRDRERARDILIDRDGLSAQQLMLAVEELENGDVAMDALPAIDDPPSSLPSPATMLANTPIVGGANDLLRRSRWCPSCDKMIVRDFARHKREVHGESKPLPCDLCGSVFKYKRSLQVHVKRKHDISWENYRQTFDVVPPTDSEPQDLSLRTSTRSPEARFRDEGAT
ncbi:zinc finger and BTB domain-containing protein 45-like [Amphibalanus amphitrite]|uniref:zinc finger and BTB domain-containing protein 45-like n=1 Tax=Amphibalanus amphitrite TaxID=1232801 RepID=UPI001C916550|nr:zinc finger and BTB domain-containing protein 45-like [Amphibalanus amphitrite]